MEKAIALTVSFVGSLPSGLRAVLVLGGGWLADLARGLRRLEATARAVTSVLEDDSHTVLPLPEAEHMGMLAVQAGRELGCRDYWRVDFRMDSAGRPWILEVNTLPGLQPGYSDMTRMADPAGIGYDGLVKAIIDSARARS